MLTAVFGGSRLIRTGLMIRGRVPSRANRSSSCYIGISQTALLTLCYDGEVAFFVENIFCV